MKILKYLQTWIKSIFTKPKAIQYDVELDWRIKSYIEWYLGAGEDSTNKFNPVYHSIHYIKVCRISERVNISIYTNRPGLIIGLGGKDYNILKDGIETQIGESVILNLIEYSPWYSETSRLGNALKPTNQ